MNGLQKYSHCNLESIQGNINLVIIESIRKRSQKLFSELVYEVLKQK